ncbi:MAG: fibronectin type III domain-containing protein [Actinomycetota bacterium]
MALRAAGVSAVLVGSLLVIPAARAEASTPYFTAVSAGNAHSCGLTTSGIVACWGSNGALQLGTTQTPFGFSNVPVAVAGLAGAQIASIGTGTGHSCAVTTAGAVSCWGQNTAGSWENPVADPPRNSVTPVPVAGAGSGVTAVSGGVNFTCARFGSGAVKCWGQNFGGTLGIGTIAGKDSATQVVGLTSGVTAIAAGPGHACAIQNGALKCWGRTEFGQFGVGTPVASADTNGDGTASGPSIVGPDDCDGDPTQEFSIMRFPCALTPQQVPGFTSGVTAVSIGESNTCVVHNGALKCFGLAGVLIDTASPGLILCKEGELSCALAPVTVPGLGSGVTAVSPRIGDHACVIQSGTPKCWGSDEFGQLGTGAAGQPLRFTPVAVSGLSGTTTRMTVGDGFTCAVTNTGVASCFGANNSGQLGRSAPHPSPQPGEVAIGALPATPGPPTLTGVTRGNASATVTFSAPADPGDSAITSYGVACTSSNGGTARSATGAGSPITVTALTNGKTYTCTVKATSASGTGPSSGASAAFVPGAAPGAPTGVVARAGSTTTATGPLSVVFAAPANGGSAITGYGVSCTSADGGISRTGSGAASPIAISGATTAKTYTCKVRATNVIGTGAFSTASPPVVVGSPPPPSLTGVTRPAAGQLRVAYTPNGNNGSALTGFTARCESSNGGAVGTRTVNNPAAREITVTALTPGKSYTCKVRAINARGTGRASSASGVKTA